MIDKLAKTVLKQVKDEYPYVAHPAAMRAEITKAEKLPEEYSYEINLKDKETGACRDYILTGTSFRYRVKILTNGKDEMAEYPELINIDSRQCYQLGDIVSVAFIGGETEAVIVGG